MRKQFGVLLVVGGILASSTMWSAAQQPQRGATPQIAIDPDDIAGVVTSTRGAEAVSRTRSSCGVCVGRRDGARWTLSPLPRRRAS